MTTSKTKCASAKTRKGSKSKSRKWPDPGGLIKKAAARARKVVAKYEKLYPEVTRDCLVTSLLHDLMHLCDRDPSLGDFYEKYVCALETYASLVEQNLSIAETFGYSSGGRC